MQAKDDESVVFSWVEWPDKATRDAAMEKMMKDPRMNPETNPMPFDGKRMIFGGFAPILELGSSDSDTNLAPRGKSADKRESAGKGARH